MSHAPNFLSKWATGLSPSPTLAVDAKAKELKAAGADICGFGTGEPDVDTPDFIKEACQRALRDGKTKYAPAAGIPELREALVEKYRSFNKVALGGPREVVVSPGGKYSCYLAILATCGPGDEVVVPAPYWVSYPEMVKLAGATPRILETGLENNFKLSPDTLLESLGPETRLLILNSPSNPTGTVYQRNEIEDLVRICMEHGILILSDEIYEYLLYDGAEHFSPASMGPEVMERVITVSGFSKTFSMTGWRLGTLVANPEIAGAVAAIQSQTTSNATTFAQYGALAALRQPEETRRAVDSMVANFNRRRRYMVNRLGGFPGFRCFEPKGAFYVFPDIAETGLSGDRFAERLLEEKQVALVPGSGFGYPDGIRLSYATSDEVIEKGLDRIEAFLKGNEAKSF